ncbi:MAG: tail fiber domain-containing protein, partial [Cyanobacteriota bacterium]|nr:tail fiber domain-containing protein [Cyanobacteriota bacterium]
NSDGHGVVITEIEGNNNALVIRDIETAAPFPAVGIENHGSGNTLYAKNTGSGWVAHFEGSKESDGHGLVITDIGGDHNALLIRDCSTNYPAVAIENSGSGNGLFIDSKGSGYSIHTKGNIYVEGKVQEASSIALKENVKNLHYQDAIEALKALNPVHYNYKADEQKKACVGFIAEEVPDLVASDDRKKLSSMDIVAVLTKVVQEQQNTIVSLMERVKELEKKQ